MAKKKKDEPLDFENMTPEELLKYEIADEIGPDRWINDEKKAGIEAGSAGK